MSKELKALKELQKRYGKNFSCQDDERCRIIETALKDYEHSQQQRELYFKQAKELKELYKEELKNTAYYNNLALKYKKALEIIKEKVLDMDYFNIIADRCNLTYQEYELLKEIML